MGLAIISIIIFHFSQDTKSADYNYTLPLQLFFNYVWSTGVDVFMLLSGMSIFYSLYKSYDIKSFYIKRFKRIIIPYLLVCGLGYIYLDIILSKNISTFIKHISFYTLFENGDVSYWFILIILLCYLLSPFLYKLIIKWSGKFPDLIFVLLCVLLFAGIIIYLFYNWKDCYKKFNIAIARIPFFVIGMIAGKMSIEGKKFSMVTPLIFIVSIFLINIDKLFSVTLARITYASYVITFLIMATIIADNLISKLRVNAKSASHILSWFGKHSLEIYLCHITIRKIFHRFNMHCSRYRYEALMILLTLISAAVIKKITDILSTKIHIKQGSL